MEYELKDGVVHIKLLDGVITMTKEEADERMRLNENTVKFLEKWLDLFGTESWGIQDIPVTADYYARSEVQLEAIKREIENILSENKDHSKELSSFNETIRKFIDELKTKISIPIISNKEILQYQIDRWKKLLHFVFYTHSKTIAGRQMAGYRACADFQELIEKFGDAAELTRQYESARAFAPNKKLFIQRRMTILKETNDRYQATHHGWYPDPENKYQVSFGEYKRIGYAWVMGGYNATWKDLDSATLRNVSINAAVPFECRDEAYASLIYYLIQGGALAYHICFLQDELDKMLATPYAGMQLTTHKIHFEDFSGEQFERLVFAAASRDRKWQWIEWLGESGADGGRDIWGGFENASWCYQCANYGILTFAKVKDDIDKLKLHQTIPDNFIVAGGGKVSAALRRKIIAYAKTAGIDSTMVWSGAEFEEMLRNKYPDLIERFMRGDSFPETKQI